MKNNDWKDRLNVVYSTNPDFGYEMDNDEEQVTLDKAKQNLRVSIDKKNRADYRSIWIDVLPKVVP